MKKGIIFFVTILSVLLTGPGGYAQKPVTTGQQPGISLADAEKVLGEPAVLISHSTGQDKGILKDDCGYSARQKDAASGFTGSVYFTVKRYPTPNAAHKAYADIVTANRYMAGQEKITMGDEAYFHTDGTHFYLIMVRKGTEMAALKVNKITSKTSLSEFKALAARMAARKSMIP